MTVFHIFVELKKASGDERHLNRCRVEVENIKEDELKVQWPFSVYHATVGWCGCKQSLFWNELQEKRNNKKWRQCFAREKFYERVRRNIFASLIKINLRLSFEYTLLSRRDTKRDRFRIILW